MAKKILILGGTGFIGYNLCLFFVKKKFEVTAIHKNKLLNKNKISKVRYLNIDLNNFNKLNIKIKNNFDYVINAAGYVDHKSYKLGGEQIINNYFNSIKNITKIVDGKNLKKFIQIGTSNEYGLLKSPQKESSICMPNTPYSLSRKISNDFLLMLNQSQNFPVIIFRVFLLYGPYQEENRLIPYIIKNLKLNKKINITNKEFVRDFLHIDDFINLIYLSLKEKKCKVIYLMWEVVKKKIFFLLLSIFLNFLIIQ